MQFSLGLTQHGQTRIGITSRLSSAAKYLLSPLLISSALFSVTSTAEENLSKGEYIARLGNCIACHTVEDGKPFAGGFKMAMPNVGVIYTTNITPDPETGIGNYTFEEFDDAMRLGVAKDGHNLYPAMPYPSYAKITEPDMRDLYDYFMNAETDDIGEAMYELEEEGYTEEEISMLWSGNLLRVLDEVQKVAHQLQADA